MLVIQILIVGVVACAIFDLWQRLFQKTDSDSAK